MPTVHEQHYTEVPLDQVTPHPDNAREGDIGQIGGLIEENGFYGAIVVQQSTGHILVGNHRYYAAQQAGLTHLPALYINVDDDRARRILLSDNRSNDLASYDDAALVELLQSFDDLEGTGFSGDDLDDLLAKVEEPVTLPPEPTDAHYSETEQEAAQRAESRKGETLADRGLREVVLVLKAHDHDEFSEHVETLRRRYDDNESTQGEIVLRAIREAVS